MSGDSEQDGNWAKIALVPLFLLGFLGCEKSVVIPVREISPNITMRPVPQKVPEFKQEYRVALSQGRSMIITVR